MTDETAQAAPDSDQQPEAPTQTVQELQAALDALTGKYERAQKDIAKYRTRADEVAAAQKAAEEKALAEKTLAEQVEALKAQLAERDAATQEAAAKATAAERKAALKGEVADPLAALKLLDEAKHLDSEGSVNVTALLADYPFLAPAAKTVGTSSKASSSTGGDGAPKSLDDFDGKPQSYFDKHWDAFAAKHGY